MAARKNSSKGASDRSKHAGRTHDVDKSSAQGSVKKRKRRSKRPVLRFVLMFMVLMGLYYASTATDFIKNSAFPAYLRLNAQVSASVLSVFEDSVQASGQAIHGRFPLTIERGCDAIEPSALFIAGVLAFPVGLRLKIPGMLIGTLCLAFINIFRIVSLYYVGVYIPKWFQIMHVDVWQAVFIFIAIVFWFFWALWASKPRTVPRHDTQKTN